jgi:hypothetical protein
MDILNILKDKKPVLTSFLRILSDEKTIPGLRKLKVSQETDLETKVKILCDVVANQQSDMKKIVSILLIYAQSKSFDSDAVTYLNKIGKGEEAIKTMFENLLK